MSMAGPDPLFALLARALDGAALRQAVHTANLANASVEGFRRLDVSFDSELERARAALDAGAPPEPDALTAPQVVQTEETVRLDREMALMAKDAVQYQALLGAFDGSMSLLRLAVREGREG
jgi:flagellar basal-body rod protein FlgB